MWLPIPGDKSMNLDCCCQKNQRTGPHRVRKSFGWMVPGALLVLMPKCPMCLAAYVALGTGLTMSYSSAHILMRAVTVICIGALALCLIRRVVSSRHDKQTFNA